MSRRTAFAKIQTDAGLFSERVIGMPLYRYQREWATHTLNMAAEGRTEAVVVEMPRQSGKNEASAHVEVGLLARMGRKGGGIVKCAPTWKPQIVNSKMRFEARANDAAQRLRWLAFRPTHGYIYKCGNAAIQFLSADPKASVVGATASLLMEVDEAQDVDKAKYDKDFAPMRAARGAPAIFYGTTWTDDTLLEREKSDILEGRSPGRYFRVTPDQVVDENPAYGVFLEQQISKLGRNHPLVKTQYFLEPLANRGRLFTAQQLRMMIGTHPRKDSRTDESQIVAGLDFAGADEATDDLASLATGSARDSVALTIGSVDWVKIADGLMEPVIKILARYEWINVNPVTLHSALYQILWERWKVDRLHSDATGIGATGTAFLAQALNRNRERVHGVTFDGAWKAQTELAFQYIAVVNGARLLDYRPSFDPLEVSGQESPDEDDPDRHAWWQRGHARIEAKPGKRARVYVPEAEGHDDLVVSDMLLVDAAYNAGAPRAITTSEVNFYG